MVHDIAEILVVVGRRVGILPVLVLYSFNAMANAAHMPGAITEPTTVFTHNIIVITLGMIIFMVLYRKMAALTSTSEFGNRSLRCGQCHVAGVSTGNPAARRPLTGGDIYILV
jgi:hypothetical protein